MEVGWEKEFRYLGQNVSFVNRREKELEVKNNEDIEKMLESEGYI